MGRGATKNVMATWALIIKYSLHISKNEDDHSSESEHAHIEQAKFLSGSDYRLLLVKTDHYSATEG